MIIIRVGTYKTILYVPDNNNNNNNNNNTYYMNTTIRDIMFYISA